MLEKLNTGLLFVLLVLCLILVLRKQPQQRFIPVPGRNDELVLDSATGQLCWPYPREDWAVQWKDTGIQRCVVLSSDATPHP